MTRAGVVLCVAVLIVTASAAEAGTVDQQVSPVGGAGFANGGELAQTFTVGTTGVLDQFDLYLSKNGYLDDLYVDLRTTSGGAPTESDSGSNILANFTLANADMSQNTWESFLLSSGVSVTAGDVLAIVVRTETTVTDPTKNPSWGADTSNPYAGGARYSRGPGGTWNAVSTWDMAFKSYVDTTAVPLPASAWLGLGMLGLLGAARKIRNRRRTI